MISKLKEIQWDIGIKIFTVSHLEKIACTLEMINWNLSIKWDWKAEIHYHPTRDAAVGDEEQNAVVVAVLLHVLRHVLQVVHHGRVARGVRERYWKQDHATLFLLSVVLMKYDNMSLICDKASPFCKLW